MHQSETVHLLKSLGLPDFTVHNAFNHFDFLRGNRRILVIGPMGSGKTEYSSRVWRDSRVALRKSSSVGKLTSTEGADRREVFFIRSQLDGGRFLDYPEDALAFRGGYERCGDHIARIRDSFGLESLVEEWPHVGTWIIDEAAFYDERLAYVVARESRNRGLVFIFPTLVLNFRREIFNPTTRLLLEVCTDVFPLTAYCEHEDCLRDSFYTYRYYTVNERECPALYFDPLIVIGGDREKADDREPNYSTRCDEHHYLPGKEYTFLTLKPLGQAAASGKVDGLRAELSELSERRGKSALERDFVGRYSGASETGSQGVYQNALSVSCLAERALLYLFAEQNLVGEDVFLSLVSEFSLDTDYLRSRLSDAGRSVNAAWANADSHSA